jgi:hypothetical protein
MQLHNCSAKGLTCKLLLLLLLSWLPALLMPSQDQLHVLSKAITKIRNITAAAAAHLLQAPPGFSAPLCLEEHRCPSATSSN